MFQNFPKGGQYKSVINWRPLNGWIRYQHFKMEGIHVLRDVLLKGDYFTQINTKDAYLTIPMHQNFQRFHRFRWLKQDFEFTCLPFWLASAPCACVYKSHEDSDFLFAREDYSDFLFAQEEYQMCNLSRRLTAN